MIKKSALINILLVAAFLILVLVPDAKAALLNGLMKIGLFKPDVAVVDPEKKGSAPDMQMIDGNGNIVSLSSMKGKVLFINFWATWCPPCRAEMPSINKLYGSFAAEPDIAFIMIDADGNYTKAKKFLDRKKYSFPLYTMAGAIPGDYFSGALPTTVVIDRKGELVFKHEGLANYSDKRFTDFLLSLLKDK